MSDALFRRPLGHALLLALLAGLILFSHLGETHLANFDDCYYAQKAKEMVRTGDWLTPHYDGAPRFDNAPLFLWLMAGAMSVLGITNFAAICFSTVSGVLSIALLVQLARRLGLSDFGSWTAGLVLLASPYFTKFARHAMFDVFLTLLFLIAMWGYVRAFEGRRQGYLLLGVAAGLGILTKSVLGLFPWAVAIVHLVWSGRASDLRDRWLWLGLAVTIATALPWYLYSYAHHGDAFLREHVRWLLWERAFMTGAGRPTSKYLGYLLDLWRNHWPWIPVALAGLWLALRTAVRGARGGSAMEGAGQLSVAGARLALVWLAVVIGVMSLANEQKLWYVMSVFPALAILSAEALSRWIAGQRWRRGVVLGGYAALALVAAVVNWTPVRLSRARTPDLHEIALAAKDLVPPGERVLNLDADFWSTNNLFLYYSDRSLTEPLHDAEALRDGIRAGRTALLRAERYEAVALGRDELYPIAARAGSWVLVRGGDE